MPSSLNNKTILVTGAGSGLGKEVALAFAQEGATVLLLGKDQKKLHLTYDSIVNQKSPTPVVIPLDLETIQENEVNHLFELIQEHCGSLDGLLHCASRFIPLSPLSNQHVDQWRQAFNTNVMAVFALTKGLLPLLKKSSDASVLFTIEHHGLHLSKYWGGFGLTQATLVHLMQLFSEEHVDHPTLRFNLIAPGPIATPMRIRTHPGEINQNQRPARDVVSHFVYWMSSQSFGKSGQVIDLSTG